MGWITAGAIAAGAAASFLGAADQNKAAERLSREQMRFQERMSSTAYQRRMVDMKAAGLNPILAASAGGASTPAGAMAPVVNPVEKAVSSASQAGMMVAQIKNLKAQTALTEQNERKVLVETNRTAAELERFQTTGGSVAGNTADSVIKMLKAGAEKAKALSAGGNSAKSPISIGSKRVPPEARDSVWHKIAKWLGWDTASAKEIKPPPTPKAKKHGRKTRN